MRQAIITRYLGPTNYRGARVKASCEAGSITVAWNYDFVTSENHRAAAKALIEKLGWVGHWAGGGLEDGYVFVDVENSGARFYTP